MVDIVQKICWPGLRVCLAADVINKFTCGPIALGLVMSDNRQLKRSPNRLVVDDTTNDGDNSIAVLSAAKLEGMFTFVLLSKISM